MEISAAEFQEVRTLLHSQCGIALSDDKTYLLQTRLEPLVRARQCATFGEYLGLLRRSHATELRDEMLEALATNETSFFRDGHPFMEFRRRILPDLAETIRRRRVELHPAPLARIWSAGCSTGQEVYSLAIAVHETLPALSPGIAAEHFPILATDLSGKALASARTGLYFDRELERGLTPEQRSRFFRPVGDRFEVAAEVRRYIEFRRLNLAEAVPTLGPFDVIFCRNVLIYFDVDLRRRILRRFEELLAPKGLLIVGAAESLYGVSASLLPQTLGSTTVYRVQ